MSGAIPPGIDSIGFSSSCFGSSAAGVASAFGSSTTGSGSAFASSTTGSGSTFGSSTTGSGSALGSSATTGSGSAFCSSTTGSGSTYLSSGASTGFSSDFGGLGGLAFSYSTASLMTSWILGSRITEVCSPEGGLYSPSFLDRISFLLACSSSGNVPSVI